MSDCFQGSKPLDTLQSKRKEIQSLLRNAEVETVSEFLSDLSEEDLVQNGELTTYGFDSDKRHFYDNRSFSRLIDGLWGHYRGDLSDSRDQVFLEVGSGLGTASLHLAAAGINSYGVEIEPLMVEKAREVRNEACEKNIIDSHSLCSYAQVDATENPIEGWLFDDGETIAMNDADVIYASFMEGEVADEMYTVIAENMSEDASAILPNRDRGAKEKYFEVSENLDLRPGRSMVIYEPEPWVYQLKTRPSDYSSS